MSAMRSWAMHGIMRIVRGIYPSVRQISTAELAAWLSNPTCPAPFLLDARRPEEFAVSHLRGARRVDPGAPVGELLPMLDVGRSVVVYCAAGYRSSALARRLQKEWPGTVFNLEGSIFQWSNEERPLESEGQPVSQVHPCSRAYSPLLKHPSTA